MLSPQSHPEEIFSDDSSFYGDEQEKAEWEELASTYNPKHYWTNIHPHLLSTTQYKAKSADQTMDPTPMEIDPPNTYLPLNRRGDHELISNFLIRLPPSCTRTATIGPWIFVYNPHRTDKGAADSVPSFVAQGTRALHAFENEKAHVTLQHDRSGTGSRSAVALGRKLTPVRQALEREIFSLARQHGVVTGKWMMFITPDRVDRYWGIVVEATVRGELGVAAKVAAKEDGDGEGQGGRARLIAVYTRDYEDREDVKRVLRRMMELDLVRRGERPIYYKCDALTYLEILANNPYGLKASLFSSGDVFAGKA